MKASKDPFKNVPRKVRILGQTVNVVITPLKGLCGLSEPDKYLISLSDTMTEELALMTLFHECIHMALYYSGTSFLVPGKTEEAIVRALESAFNHIIDIKKLQVKE